MEKALHITILILLVIVGVISVMGLSQINAIADKIDSITKRETNQNAQSQGKREITAGELSSALRAKLSGADVSELNVKFQQA